MLSNAHHHSPRRSPGRRRVIAAWFGAALAATAPAQTPPPNGPRTIDPRWHALVHATLVAAPGEQLDDATIVMRDGVIVSVTAAAAPPAGAQVWDCSGHWVYAGLIEPHAAVDAPAPPADPTHADRGSRTLPQRDALDGPGLAAAARAELRGLGFAAAVLAPKDGVWRGTAALVLLAEPSDGEGTRHLPVVRAPIYHALGFDTNGGGYPDSFMGGIALIRQTLLDAQTHARHRATYRAHPEGLEPPPTDAALEALHGEGREGLPLVFDCPDELDALAAIRIARELGREPIVLGGGTEFRRLAALAEDHAPLLLPLAFPEPPPVQSLAEAESVTLRDLMTWEQAPTNPRRMAKAGLTVALTTHRMEKRSEFRAQLRRALRHGLSDADALAMLTVNPARIFGVAEQLGTVAAGKLANLVVADGPLFAVPTRVLDVWVRGQRHVVYDPAIAAMHGTWSLDLGATAAPARLTIGDDGVTLLAADKKTVARDVAVTTDRLDCTLAGDALGQTGFVVVHAVRDGDRLYGESRSADGTRGPWLATRTDPQKREVEPEPDDASDVPEVLPQPFGAYGLTEPPAAPAYTVVANATLWGWRGQVVPNGALVVQGDRIVWSGPATETEPLEGARIIDARGKHVTPGLIDCHSHTGIRGGVNEGGQAVTAEVRILDALDPDDVNWYRQLAGGVTMVNQLHGSANPIGGQSNVAKLRWGVTRPEAMVVRGARPGIKFALGENVKRSRDPNSTRYPKTRMGVEALLRDRFAAARDLAGEWQRWRQLAPADAERRYEPRRDLELEALAEVLIGVRLVHCHSYRQDEILMLCRLAKELGFKIGTLQHGLEAYKVAEAVRDAARGASVFSDWWGYKVEVQDAVPQCGSILHDLGVAVSFNSDSNELARRLNTEAAKAVKYGGTEPLAALGFVTRGPAVQLALEDRYGTLDMGMTADFAIWSASPLSSLARCEATFVDGLEYFSLERDRALRAQAAAERARLVQKVLRLAKPAREPKPDDSGSATKTPPKLDRRDEPAGGQGVCGCEEVGR